MNARSPEANICGAVTVDTAVSTQVVAANPSRIYMRITNDDSANPLYLALTTDGSTPAAVLNSGIRLAAGESWETTSYTGIVHGLAGTADVVACVVEM